MNDPRPDTPVALNTSRKSREVLSGVRSSAIRATRLILRGAARYRPPVSNKDFGGLYPFQGVQAPKICEGATRPVTPTSAARYPERYPVLFGWYGSVTAHVVVL